MAKLVQQVCEPTSAATLHTYAQGVLVVDTSFYGLRVHDGVTPGGNLQLSAAANLGDLPDIVKARDNLGLGSAALLNDDAGFMLGSNNLEEITDPATSRGNIAAAKSGANTDLTTVILNNGGLALWNAGKTHMRTIVNLPAVQTADRALNLIIADKDVSISISDDVVIDGPVTHLSGANTGDQHLAGDIASTVDGTDHTQLNTTIADGAVTTDKIAASAVTSAKMDFVPGVGGTWDFATDISGFTVDNRGRITGLTFKP